ncbi:glucose/arabinose dehydrogenase [Dyadobacter sp. BE34]|uniref:Glucose/arabinose dehydrogenase n=1 Tax=Dyadobacter fermentans TaxID=94254 RepID=A0ABU1QW70_9BACT|nr:MULTISPECIES: PQQ-dependent sugar dehydrogenase [Dyadobacter]MDR6805413.1 glucose/arabinose dehydrogenase [Dyadobacter fermentans]MDR7042827.1 glucose/arabinose dehydrogenase [Dyadobacter sp. BE242]MDR7197139.1 glucose/arabinose dehydrogenase [Dyadobacter sp. BE34]MDR7215426.1 glucose/arabinose dehydrogenase [Dyadobacter sp. BE31]MDR7262962.1 glucose/arabinose dehydrogenase [Dyadobacter sp. BE32]
MKNLLCIVLLLIGAVHNGSAQLNLAIEPVASGFTRPVKVTHASDGRLFVAEIGGKIKIFKNGAVLSQPFLDIGAKINDPDWAGIFSIAFPPDYQTSGFFYVLYVVKSLTEVQVSRFSRQAGNADLADANSEVKILTIPYGNVLGGHRGGDMAFGKDGFLYISTGDNGPGSRGVPGDPDNNSQDMGKLFGKLLRLDTGSPSPGDNPLGKIFALGLRNPWRFGFDRQTGDLWIGDNGQDGWEEINYLAYPFGGPPSNFGWNCLEGTQSYNPSHCAQGTTYTAPRLTYPGYTNNGGNDASVMGGFVYRGSRYPSMKGHYFFGDYSSGKIGYIDPLGVASPDAGPTYSSLISFGEDQAGELYILSFLNGTLSKITNPGDPLPVKLLSIRLAQSERRFLVEWKTAEETQFSHFDVQRGSDGRTFQTLGTLHGKGAGSSYVFTDGEPLRNANYYRLKMVDLDGTFQYSSLVTGTLDKRGQPFVFPNPGGSSVITIAGLAKGDRVTIYNTAGLLVQSYDVTTDEDWKVNMDGRQKGMYTVFIDNTATGFSKKLKIAYK